MVGALCLASELSYWRRRRDQQLTTRIDSLDKMKSHLPTIRKQLKSDPAYFKKVYMHTFDLSKAPGARTLVLDTGEYFMEELALSISQY